MAAKKTSSPASRPATRAATPATPAAPAAPVSTTAVRNSPIPRPQTPSGSSGLKKQITQEQIARRAYEIWQSGKGGSQQDNWYRAERELRAT